MKRKKQSPFYDQIMRSVPLLDRELEWKIQQETERRCGHDSGFCNKGKIKHYAEIEKEVRKEMEGSYPKS